MIPMVNKARYPEIKHEIERGYAETVDYCSFILEPNLQAFKNEVAAYHGDGVGVHVHRQHTLLCDRRDEAMKALPDQQIGSAVYCPVPLHKQNVFKACYATLSLAVTESVAVRCFSLLICSSLGNEAVQEISGVIRAVLAA